MPTAKTETPKAEEKKLTYLQRISRVQEELKAPKSRYNSFGGYNYRCLEDILEAVKPLLVKYDLTLIVSDEPYISGDWHYVKATAYLYDSKECNRDPFYAVGFAREPLEKKKMDVPQVSGTASSYARKYALNGLFLIDDTKDADTDEYHKQTEEKPVNTSKDTVAKKYSDALEGVLVNHPNIKSWALKHYKIDSIAKLTNAQYNEVVAMIKKNENTSENK